MFEHCIRLPQITWTVDLAFAHEKVAWLQNEQNMWNSCLQNIGQQAAQECDTWERVKKWVEPCSEAMYELCHKKPSRALQSCSAEESEIILETQVARICRAEY